MILIQRTLNITGELIADPVELVTLTVKVAPSSIDEVVGVV